MLKSGIPFHGLQEVHDTFLEQVTEKNGTEIVQEKVNKIIRLHM